jgi:hypothetical protein
MKRQWPAFILGFWSYRYRHPSPTPKQGLNGDFGGKNSSKVRVGDYTLGTKAQRDGSHLG